MEPTIATKRPAERASLFSSISFTRRASHIILYIILIAGSIVFILPLIWMISTSLKPNEEVFSYPPTFIPSQFMWQNYVIGWTQLPFNTFLRNSIIICANNVIGNLISCTMAAYAFARLRSRFSNVLFLLVLGTMMLPAEVTWVPQFIMFKTFGWINTLLPLTVPAWFGWPFFIFLLRQFFMTLPTELDDAARIDGASHFRIFWNITLPLAKPALATVAIFSFIANWNNWLSALIYIRSDEWKPLALGLQMFKGQYMTYFNQMMAVSVLQLLPVLILFFFAQKTFIRGVALTGLKG